MTVEYNVENPYDIKDELLPLNIKHYEEDFRKGTGDLVIDWEKYKALHESGALLLVTARVGNKLIAYMSTTISEHPHNKGHEFASMDTLFVDKEWRGKSIASELIETTEDILEDRGVSWFTVGFRSAEVAEAVTGKMGYKKVECIFGKTLGSKQW